MLVISLATEQGVLSWLLFQPLSQVQNQKGSKQTVDERPQDRAASCCSPRVPLKPHRSHLRTPPTAPSHTPKETRGDRMSIHDAIPEPHLLLLHSGSRSECLHLCPPPSAINQMGELSLQGSLIAES